MSLWHSIGTQLQNPRGLAGRLAGALMRVANDRPNRLAVDALGIAPGDAVLELGFGPGHAIELMAARATAGVIHGIDQSRVMHEQAEKRNRAAIRERRVFLHRGSFERLPFADASIDKVAAVNVIYFWRDPAAIFGEVRRVLRPGGRVAVYATDAAMMRGWKFAGSETHRLFDAAELSHALRCGGFDPRQVSVVSFTLAGRLRGLLATGSNGTASRLPDDDRSDRPVGGDGA